MEPARVTLREMTVDEYQSYVEEVQAAVVRELVATMPEEEARATAAGGIAQYLPEERLRRLDDADVQAPPVGVATCRFGPR
jgi:hypothetical protein